MILSRDEVHEIMSEVLLAPSAHNSQPAQWRYRAGEFELSFDKNRRLKVADPEDHDLILSLGSQIEGLDLSLRARKKMISNVLKSNDGYTIQITENTDKAPQLFKYISKRKTYRGTYKNKEELSDEALKAFEDKTKFSLVLDSEKIKDIGKLYDQASLEFFRDVGYTKELYSWLRFKKSEPKWHQDGLNQDAMSLTPVEAFGASQVLKPKVFKFLDSIGLASFLVSEQPKIKTSSFILCLLKDRSNNDHIELGRFFYRSWLLATSQNFNLCPLSNLVDHLNYKNQLEQLLRLPEELEVFKIFRAGPEPEKNKMPGRYRVDIKNFYTFNGES